MSAAMPPLVLLAVLLAALMHAAWNAALKSQPDTFLAALAVSAGAGLVGAALLPFLPAPAGASWPFIAASGAIHVVYYLLLAWAYRHADISHAYPLMRGGAPVLVALAASTLAGERLQAAQWAAIGLICAGGVVLTIGARARTADTPVGPSPTLLALMAAVLIAGYTLVDGLGVRRSGSPASYTAWILILGALGAIAVSWRRTEGRLPAFVLRKPGLVLLGGVATTGSYGIALWAMTQAPVAVVAALRETSIVFATGIAALLLRERMTRARVAGAGIIALGAVAMRLA